MSAGISVSARIEEIQYELMGHEFSKSGVNNYNHTKYHELADIMPPIVAKCHEKDLMLMFNFTSDLATLTVADKHDIKDCCNFTMPMPKEGSLNTMNEIQSIGAFATYLKRYLLVNTFLILEADVVDALNPKEERQSESKNNEPLIKEKEPVIPKPVTDALLKLDKTGKKITPQTVWAAIDKSEFKNNPDLRQKCRTYIENNIKKGGK